MNRILALFGAVGTVLSCVTAQFPQPPQAVDKNPDPHVFETVLVAAHQDVQLLPGKKTRLWTYNGSFPGPTIDVALGDRVIVHLVNLLPEPTSIHWHGVETPAEMDGSHLAQAPVPPSGYFRYEFVANNAGSYWYHPHFHTNEQVEKGLYGAIVVRDPRHDQALGVPKAREHVLFLDDIRLDKENQVAPFATDPRSEYIPYNRAEDLVNSRVGNHLLINGQLVDGRRLAGLDVKAGEAHRLRFYSVSSGYIWRLSVPDAHATWHGVGSDQGLWNAAEVIRPITQVKDFRGHHDLMISDYDPGVGVTLTPSDRIETVLVGKGAAGAEFALEAHDFIKGKHIAFRGPDGGLGFGHDHFDGAEKPQPVLAFKIVGAVARPWQPPVALRWDPIQPLQPDRSQPPLAAFFGHSVPHKVSGDVMFFLNVDKDAELLAAARKGEPVLPIDFEPLPMMKLRSGDGYQVKVGETRYWEIVNFTGSDHNFHVHGFPFQHLETVFVDRDEAENNRTVKPRRLAYEDTIRIPKRPNYVLGRSYTIVRLAVRFDDAARPAPLRRRVSELLAGGMLPGFRSSGGWLVHCHFLEHSAKGMQSFLTVTR